MFCDENPIDMAPIMDIETQIEFLPGAALPNRPAYRTTRWKQRNFERQVNDLLDKAHIQKRKSTCEVHVLWCQRRMEHVDVCGF